MECLICLETYLASAGDLIDGIGILLCFGCCEEVIRSSVFPSIFFPVKRKDNLSARTLEYQGAESFGLH